MYQPQPIRVSAGSSLGLVLLVILNTIHITQMANNEMEINPKEVAVKTPNLTKPIVAQSKVNYTEDNSHECPANLDCLALKYPCVKCEKKPNCVYGKSINYTCTVLPQVSCKGDKTFTVIAMCRFCYQTEHWEHRCIQKANCNSVASPRQLYPTNCTVLPEIVCLGRRTFSKRVVCAWTGGARWGTALALALALGGFGADRFYLGHWQEGIGKLFSFGGLGVWTLVDALLIGVHHLGPADGSLYI